MAAEDAFCGELIRTVLQYEHGHSALRVFKDAILLRNQAQEKSTIECCFFFFDLVATKLQGCTALLHLM